MNGQCADIDKLLKTMQQILETIASSDDSIYRLEKANEFASQMQIVHFKIQSLSRQIADLGLRPEFHLKADERSDSLKFTVERAIEQFGEHPLISDEDLSIQTSTTMRYGEMSPLLANPHSNPYSMMGHHCHSEDMSPSMRKVFKALFTSISSAQKQVTDAQEEGEMYAKTQVSLHKGRKKVVTGLVLSIVSVAIIVSYIVVLSGK